MDLSLYKTIFKRKSFHLFRNLDEETISEEEIGNIYNAYLSFEALYPEIKTKIRIVKAEDVDFKRGGEYCVLLYSEKKDNYLINAGFIAQQLDLYLVSKDIGTLYFGIGKADIVNYEGLDFVIMIAMHKVSDQSLYRKDLFKAKRKPIAEMWYGDTLGIGEIARFSPSACNSQPWFVNNTNEKLEVYRYKKDGKRGIMPADKVVYYNRIDIGIFLCILQLCMMNKGISISRTMFIDNNDVDEYVKIAEYRL